MESQRKGSDDLYQYRGTDLDGKRHKAKNCVDGYTDFILVNQSRNPRVAHDLCTRFRDIYSHVDYASIENQVRMIENQSKS